MNQDPNNIVQTEITPPVIQPDTTPTEDIIEEPVMITANIDEMPQDQIPESILSQNEMPQVNEQVEVNNNQVLITPDLGKEEKEEVVPTFQDFANIPTDTEEEIKEKLLQQEEPQSRVEISLETTPPEAYQATSQRESSAPFQELGEIPVEGETNNIIPEEEEDEVEQPKKKGKFLLLIIIVILLILIALGLIFVVIPSFRNSKVDIKKKTIGNINIAIVGDVNSTKDALFVKLTGNTEDIEHKCQDESNYDVTYSLMKNEISSEKRTYNLRYPCGYQEFFKYAILSDGIEKIDGAILVLKASDSVQSQTVEIASTLNKVGVDKLIVFISQSENEQDNQVVKTDINDLLSAKGYDKTKTPVIIGNIENEQDIKKLLTEADSWFNNTKYEEEQYVVQKHNKIKVYTYLKTTDEGGETTPMQNKDKYTFKLDKELKGEIELPEGLSNITPGNTVEVTIKLDSKQSIQEGMKIPFYKEDKIIAIGIVDKIVE